MPALPVIPADAQPYVNAPQLARWLKVHPRTIHRWANEGRLPQPIRLTARTLWFEVNAVRAALAKLFDPSASGDLEKRTVGPSRPSRPSNAKEALADAGADGLDGRLDQPSNANLPV